MTALQTIATAASLVVGLTSCSAAQDPAAHPLAHTRTEFHFVVNAPFELAAPLFGAEEERKWSPGWDPQFVYPTPAHDQAGMVFQVNHEQHSSVWVNTAFDLVAGHIQYAYVLNDAMVTLIDIRLTREGPQKTAVNVCYERTALKPEANDHVQHFAKGDETSGLEWAQAINGYFARQAGQK